MTVDWNTFTAENGPKFELALSEYRSHRSSSKFVIAVISLLHNGGWTPTPDFFRSLAMYLPQEERIQVAVHDEGQANLLVLTTLSRAEILLLNPSDPPPPIMTSEQLHALFLGSTTGAADMIFSRLTNPSWVSGIMELLHFELNSCGEQDPDCRRSCTHYLHRLSRSHGVLPPSFFLDDLVKEGDHPQWGGGFADVWKGYKSGRPVCLKVLRFFTTANMRMKLIKQFCREALVWKQLDHPNVLPFLGVSTELFAPSFCLVSPWMNNSNLMVYLEKNPDHDKMKALLEVAEGLVYLHNYSPSIVHADIRGANILVTDQLTCCLADFGLASAAQSQSFTTTSTNEGGSVRWMAPELLMPSENDESNRQNLPSRDVYAFGCTILEIYTGKPPFQSLTHGITVSTVVVSGQRPARPTSIASDRLWALVESCWVQDPLRRPSSRQILTSLQLINEPVLEPQFPPYTERPSSPQLSMSSSRQNIHALIIGINKYNKLDELKGAVNDALNFEKFLRDDLNVPQEHIRILTDKKATRTGILQAFDDHLLNNNSINDHDIIVFFFAGHGSRVHVDIPDWNTVETICPVDDGLEGIYGIPDVTFNAKLRQLKGDNIIVILDCCFSGGMNRIPVTVTNTRVRCQPTEYTAHFSPDEQKLWNQMPKHLSQFRGERPRVILAASHEDEVARENDIAKSPHGIFTQALLDILREIWPVSPSITYLDLIERVCRNNAVIEANQLPTCYGLNKNWCLFSAEVRTQLSAQPAFIYAEGRAVGVGKYPNWQLGSHRGDIYSVRPNSSVLKIHSGKSNLLFGDQPPEISTQIPQSVSSILAKLKQLWWTPSLRTTPAAVVHSPQDGVTTLDPQHARLEAALIVEVGSRHGVNETSRFLILVEEIYCHLRVHHDHVEEESSVLLFDSKDAKVYRKIPAGARVLWLDSTVRVHLPQRELKTLLERHPLVNLSFVEREDFPTVEIVYDERREVLTVKRFDPLILQLSGRQAEGFDEVELKDVEMTAIPDWVNKIAHFHYYLGLSSTSKPNAVPIQQFGIPLDKHITLRLHELQVGAIRMRKDGDGRDYFFQPGSQIYVKKNLFYGIRLVNDRSADVFASLFCFDPSSYKIELYRQSDNANDPVLGFCNKRHNCPPDEEQPERGSCHEQRSCPGDLTVGYGPGGGKPIVFEPDERVLFKLFISGQHCDLSFIDPARRGGRVGRIIPHDNLNFTGAWVVGVVATA